MFWPTVKKQKSGRRKAKVVAIGWETYLNAILVINSKNDMKKSFFERNPYRECGGFLWCESAKYPSFYLSISSNHPRAKWLVRHEIESIPSPNNFAVPLLILILCLQVWAACDVGAGSDSAQLRGALSWPAEAAGSGHAGQGEAVQRWAWNISRNFLSLKIRFREVEQHIGFFWILIVLGKMFF